MKVSTMAAPQPVGGGATTKSVTFSSGGNAQNRTPNVPATIAPPAPAEPTNTTAIPSSEPQIPRPAPVQEAKPNTSQTERALAMLSRKEQDLRKAQEDFKLAQERWRNEQGQFVSKKDLQEQTLKVLTESGITGNRLIELQLGIPASAGTTDSTDTSELAALKAEIVALRQKYESDQSTQRTQAEAVVRNDAKLLVENDAAYAVTKTLGQSDQVAHLIIQNYDETGEMLSIEEAAKLVEEELVSRTLSQAKALRELDKLKEAFRGDVGTAAPAPNTDSNAPKMPQDASVSTTPRQEALKAIEGNITQIKTLTNRMGSTRPLTARERAIQAFEKARNKA